MSVEWLSVWQCSQVRAKTSVRNSYFCGEKNWWFPQNVLYSYYIIIYINLTVPNVPTNWKNQKLHVLASCCIHVLPELPIWRQPSPQQHFIESWWSLAQCVSVLDWFTCSLKGRIPKILGTFTIFCWYCIVNLPNLWQCKLPEKIHVRRKLRKSERPSKFKARFMAGKEHVVQQCRTMESQVVSVW